MKQHEYWINPAKRAIMQQQVNHLTEYVQRPAVHSMLVTNRKSVSKQNSSPRSEDGIDNVGSAKFVAL